MHCYKCCKEYKTIKCLNNHEKTCKGIDSMTCPKCMTMFLNSQDKSNHINSNNCKAVSVYSYLNRKYNYKLPMHPDVFIHNYGEERIDYIGLDEIVEIIRNSRYYTILPEYIRCKHFHDKFHENHNIKWNGHKFMIKIDNKWDKISSDDLAKRLFNDNAHVFMTLFKKYEEQLIDILTEKELDRGRLQIFHTCYDKSVEYKGLLLDLIKVDYLEKNR